MSLLPSQDNVSRHSSKNSETSNSVVVMQGCCLPLVKPQQKMNLHEDELEVKNRELDFWRQSPERKVVFIKEVSDGDSEKDSAEWIVTRVVAERQKKLAADARGGVRNGARPSIHLFDKLADNSPKKPIPSRPVKGDTFSVSLSNFQSPKTSFIPKIQRLAGQNVRQISGSQKRPDFLRHDAKASSPFALGQLSEEKEANPSYEMYPPISMLSLSSDGSPRKSIPSEISWEDSLKRPFSLRHLRSVSGRDFGGDEGAKPREDIVVDTPYSRKSIISEGKIAEDYFRPEWTLTEHSDFPDGVPEITVFFSSKMNPERLPSTKQLSFSSRGPSLAIASTGSTGRALSEELKTPEVALSSYESDPKEVEGL